MRRHGLGWLLLAAAAVAAVTARPYAGGWNDGSRLAAVESLVDHRTFAIDESVYVRPDTAARPPYIPSNRLAARYGTQDKLFIAGRFYSDKSPVPAVLMAGTYQLWRWAGGPAAAHRPDWFARFLTWLFAGVPFLLAVWALSRAARSIRVPAPWDLVLPTGLAFGSLALPYAQHVNNHILLLAVAAGICEAAVRHGPITTRRAAWLGLLAGFGYTIDLGAGPPLTAAVGGLVFWQARHRLPVFALAALPFIVAHHALNFAVAGTLGPANANPAFFQWPGSPFHAATMTGGWNHPSPAAVGLYALELLFGKKGFLVFSPFLLLAVLAGPWLLTRKCPERPALVTLAAWAVATWLLYAATSRNQSGVCLSVRWFVPLLAPGILALAVLIRDVPATRRPLAVLLAGGMMLNLELVWWGPWAGNVPVLLWPVVGMACMSAILVLWQRAVSRTPNDRRPWAVGRLSSPPAPPAPCPVAPTG